MKPTKAIKLAWQILDCLYSYFQHTKSNVIYLTSKKVLKMCFNDRKANDNVSIIDIARILAVLHSLRLTDGVFVCRRKYIYIISRAKFDEFYTKKDKVLEELVNVIEKEGYRFLGYFGKSSKNYKNNLQS